MKKREKIGYANNIMSGVINKRVDEKNIEKNMWVLIIS